MVINKQCLFNLILFNPDLSYIIYVPSEFVLDEVTATRVNKDSVVKEGGAEGG